MNGQKCYRHQQGGSSGNLRRSLGRPRPCGSRPGPTSGSGRSRVPPSTQLASQQVRSPDQLGALALPSPSPAHSPFSNAVGARSPQCTAQRPAAQRGTGSQATRPAPAAHAHLSAAHAQHAPGAPGLPAPRGARPVRRRGGRCECVCAGEKMAAAGEAA